MVFLLEQISIHFFFVVHSILECYGVWKRNMYHFTPDTCEEEIPLWGMPRSVIETEKPQPIIIEKEVVVYKESTIEQQHDNFYQAFADSLVDCPEPEEPAYYHDMNDYAPHMESWPEPTEPAYYQDRDDDILRMESWSEPQAKVAVTKRLSSKATAQINDYEVGEQLWITEVVGEEQGYLHISDGSARAWVHTECFGTFYKGDILSLFVERKSDRSIEVKEVDILQRKSMEFSIPDEEVIVEKYDRATA